MPLAFRQTLRGVSKYSPFPRRNVPTRSATTSQPRSLLSIVGLNIAKSRVRPSICNRVRIDETCFGRNGGFCPTSLPLFQDSRRGIKDIACAWVSMVILIGW